MADTPESITTLSCESQDIINKIIVEQDYDKLKGLVDTFNINQKKKNIVRVDTFSRLLDMVSSQMSERLEKNAGSFSNKDLIDYLNAIRSAVDKNNISIADIETPIIQNNTQINVNVDTLSRESKSRIADAISSILKNVEYKEIVDSDQ